MLAELIKQKALEVAQTPFPVMYEEELQRQISQEVYHGRMQSLSNSELEQVKQLPYPTLLLTVQHFTLGHPLLTSVWSIVALF